MPEGTIPHNKVNPPKEQVTVANSGEASTVAEQLTAQATCQQPITTNSAGEIDTLSQRTENILDPLLEQIPTDVEDELLASTTSDDQLLSNLVYSDLNYEFEELPVLEATIETTGPVQKPANEPWGDYRIPKKNRTVISPIIFDQVPKASPTIQRPRKDIKRIVKPDKRTRVISATVTSQSQRQLVAPSTVQLSNPKQSVFDRLGERALKTFPGTAAAVTNDPGRSNQPSETELRRWRRAEAKLKRKLLWTSIHKPEWIAQAPRPGKRGNVDTREFSRKFNREQEVIIKDLVAPARDESGFVRPVKLQLARPELTPFVPPPPPGLIDIRPTWAEQDACSYGDHKRRQYERHAQQEPPVRRQRSKEKSVVTDRYTNTARIATKPARPGFNRRFQGQGDTGRN